MYGHKSRYQEWLIDRLIDFEKALQLPYRSTTDMTWQEIVSYYEELIQKAEEKDDVRYWVKGIVKNNKGN